jgi:hypothetical protein
VSLKDTTSDPGTDEVELTSTYVESEFYGSFSRGDLLPARQNLALGSSGRP